MPANERMASAAVSFPVAPDLSSPVAYGDSERAAILMVDDRPENRLVLLTMLEELGQDIVAVESGEAALRALLERDFAVILLDVNMPGMDGLETAGYIRRRQRNAHTPIIFLTAYAEEMGAAYSLGAVDYMLTPVVPDILRTKVKVFVQLYQMNRQTQRRADERIELAREQMARAAAEESRRRSTFLSEASDLLSNSLDVETTAKSLVQFAVPALSDLCGLMLTDEQGAVFHVELCWNPAGCAGDCRTLSMASLDDSVISSAAEQALASGSTQIVTLPVGMQSNLMGRKSATEKSVHLELGFALRSLAALPLLARVRARKVGVLLLGMGSSLRNFSTPELALAEDLAARTAISLKNCMLYAKIHEADRRKNEFLAMLAHELRNPLAPIRNAVHILRHPGLDQSRAEWASSIIDRQSHQLVRLVDDLLDVARITQGRIQLKIEPVNVASAITVAVETSRPLIEARHHELTVHVPDEPLFVEGDPTRIAQIIANIVNNAAKYTEPGGRIVITVVHDANEVEFCIRDTGMGIPHEMLESVFDLFTQSNRSHDRSQGGLGIGLTVVQRLVLLQGGSVRAFSEGLGQGSEFVVKLRRAVVTPAPSDGKMSLERVQHYSVLVVDDQPDAVESMAKVLQLHGHEVRVAENGLAAIKIAQTFRPSVVLLDIGLPDMDGYSIARRLRSQPETRNCVLVALTGYGQPEDRLRSKENGFDHHLVKPIDPDILHELFAMLVLPRQRLSGQGNGI
jgi:signal transduction histidine kinase/DNA-binding response OmpR family regulator